MECKNIRKILFVCTGNSCRSPMAEALLKKILEKQGRNDIVVYSAGTAVLKNGMPPTRETVEVLKKDGIDISGHRTHMLTKELIEDADLILTMQESHRDAVKSLVPEADTKTFLLREYIGKKCDTKDPSVPDPIGCPLEVYERVFTILKECITELVKKL